MSVSKYMPLTLLLPLVFASAMALIISNVAIATARMTTGPSSLIPVSLCFTTIILVCGAIAQLNGRVVDLERQLTELLPKLGPTTNNQPECARDEN